MTFKTSQRSNAVSLQEACEESNTVIAKYPFLRDPVEFLTAKHNVSKNKGQALKVL